MLAQRLFYLRQKNKKTQSQMAQLLGISRQAYGYYEKGEREPDAQAINLLADYFNVSTDYLFGRIDNPTTDIKKNKELDDKRTKLTEEIMSLPENEQSLITNMIKVLMDKRKE